MSEAEAGGGKALALPQQPASDELTMEQRRIQIARQLTQKAMVYNNIIKEKKGKPKVKRDANDFLASSSVSSTCGGGGGGGGYATAAASATITTTKSIEEMKELKAMRSVRTLKVISDPKNSTLYSMEHERELVTNDKLTVVLDEVQKQHMRTSTVMENVVAILKSNLELAFFGCDVNVGVMTDATNTAIEFLSDASYKRKVTRQTSTCFECLDQADIVVKVNSRASGSENNVLTLAVTMTCALRISPNTSVARIILKHN